MTHTAAPWTMSQTSEESPVIIFAENNGYFTHIAEISTVKQSYKANARLIAAAPELLKALELALQHLVYNGKHPAVISAKSAIAKAKGA